MRKQLVKVTDYYNQAIDSKAGNREARVPYQHRLLDALVRVKLGTQILAQDLSLSFG